jgi:uncharacterized membrane protein (UPF0127 family)
MKQSTLLIGAVFGTFLFLIIVGFITLPTGDYQQHGSTVVFDGINNTSVTAQVEIADTDASREYGLMNRTSMPQDHGMLFIFDYQMVVSFWMKDTLIPLDMVFLDSSGRIGDIYKNATPLSEDVYTAKSPSKYVIELNGGYCDRYGIKIGDHVTIHIVKS